MHLENFYEEWKVVNKLETPDIEKPGTKDQRHEVVRFI